MEAIKKGFFEAMITTYGNITKSCHAVSISRQTYYNWMSEDAEFKALIDSESYEERMLDMIEEKLMDEVANANTAVLIFMAKTKGKKRGYVEKTEVDLNAKSIQINFED